MAAETRTVDSSQAATSVRRPASRLTINRLGLWLFIISESFLSAAILSSRYFLRGLDVPDVVNQPLGLVLTGVLLLSSLSAYWAETCAHHDDQKRYRRNLIATIGMGIIFLVGVGIEWNDAFKHFPPHSNGTIFFTATRVHAFHVLSGLIALTFVLGLGRKGGFTSDNG